MDVPLDEEEDGPPVYEPVYPEQEYTCAHVECSRESLESERLCEKCTVLMRADAPNECSFCGTKR